MKTLPPEIVQPVLEILSYCATAVLGWIAKWLSTRKKDKALKGLLQEQHQAIDLIRRIEEDKKKFQQRRPTGDK